MNWKSHRKLVKDCIRFYEKRQWNWAPIVGYLCDKACGEMSAQAQAKALKVGFRGLRYRYYAGKGGKTP